MNIKCFKKSILALIAATTLSSAYAASHTSGAYLDGNIGVLYESVSFLGASYAAVGDFGLNTNLGYQFNTYLATELGYTGYGINHHLLNGLDLALKVMVPVTEGEHSVGLFAKIGPSYLFRGGNETTAAFAGIGASYQLTNALDVTVQAQGVTQGFFDLGLLSAGLSYHF